MIIDASSPIIARSKARKIINKNTTVKDISETQKEVQRHQKFRDAKHASQEPIVKDNLIFNGELIQNKLAMDDTHFKMSILRLETEKKMMQKNLQ